MRWAALTYAVLVPGVCARRLHGAQERHAEEYGQHATMRLKMMIMVIFTMMLVSVAVVVPAGPGPGPGGPFLLH
eukprot:214460-Rhodomonas_salina.3